MNGKRKILVIGMLIVIIAVVGAIGAYYWYENTY